MTRRLANALVTTTLLAFFAVPLLWALYASLVPSASLFGSSPSASSYAFTLDAYRSVFANRTLLLALRSSLVVAACTTLLCIALGAPASYAFARLPLRGARAVLGAMLAVSVLPQIVVVGPLFLVLRALDLVDTWAGLVLTYSAFALPLAVWLLTGAMRALPRELEESALVEGASRVRILVSIIAPLAAPAVATTAILVFIASWNEFLLALSFTVSPSTRTLPVAVASLRGEHEIEWSTILAASIIATLPVAALVLAFQRRIVAGLTSGAVK